jgi:hypothetical protein
MRRLDVDERARADRFGKALKEPHGEGRALPMRAVQEFAIEKGERHSRATLTADEPGGQCATGLEPLEGSPQGEGAMSACQPWFHFGFAPFVISGS